MYLKFAIKSPTLVLAKTRPMVLTRSSYTRGFSRNSAAPLLIAPRRLFRSAPCVRAIRGNLVSFLSTLKNSSRPLKTAVSILIRATSIF
jgi:hypothetical protein